MKKDPKSHSTTISNPEASINVEEHRDLSEKDFHLEQTKKRSQIRIEQGRPTCFDSLLQISMIYSNEISLSPSEQTPPELQQAYLYLETTNPTELENVKTAILLQLKYEKNKENREYWESLLCICEHLIESPSSILTEEINKILIDKDISGLNSLKSQIIHNIDNPTLDRNYWQEVLSSIEVYKAKLNLKQKYLTYIEKKKIHPLNPIQANNLSIKSFFFRAEEPKIKYGDGSDSPLIIEDNELPDGFELITPDDDQKDYLNKRKEILQKELNLLIKSQSRLTIKGNSLLDYDNKLLDIADLDKIVSGNVDQSIDELMKISILKKMPLDQDENEFNELANIKPVMEDWMKKYKPRKPKFFNRIKTGYEWNRHNQTHYDHKNPPPKVVQGYKFNIFYPYLIDKTRAPQFYLQPEENSDTCIIRFHSGPPYEDIAFKIDNREWDFSDRNGFKCFFDKGVLHLYFNFKRHRYKR